MFSSLCHPAPDRLSDFLTGTDSPSRTRIAAHLEHCSRCRESLAFLRATTDAARDVPVAPPSLDLRRRILSSRASGVRIILPAHDAVRPTRRWISPAVAAALLALVAGMLLIRRPGKIEAGTTTGILLFSPASPRPGQRVTVHYRPSALLATQPWLSLRARLRSSADEAYNEGLPVTTVARLQPIGTSDFTTSFVLPDSVVYGAFAVEDSTGSVIDSDAGRSWEILVSNDSGLPLFEALDQRAKDMMGRNWEEGFATVKRMVATYPHNIMGWVWLKAFQGWMGRAEDDSVRTPHRQRLVRFDSMYTRQPRVAAETEGLLAWYAQGLDSSLATSWRARLLNEAPTNSFSIQWRALAALDSLRVTHDTTRVVHQFEELWSEAPADRRAQLSDFGVGLALRTGDVALIQRWTDRAMQTDRDRRAAARRVARQLSAIPSLRREAIVRLRAEAESLETLPAIERALDETVADQRARRAGERRRVMATLGQALMTEGRPAEGRAALAEAAASGWDPDVFRAVRTASLATGDTARAFAMAAWLAADPRTPAALVDSISVSARRRLGDDGWKRELDSARAKFVERMLAGATARSLPGTVRVRDADGRPRSLNDIMKDRVTIVAFWSRSCGPAVQSLAELNSVASRMAKVGVQVVNIVDEPGLSEGLKTFLRERRITTPVYFDSWHEAGRTFNQWGTPYFYVVDAEGHIRFDDTSSPGEVLARAEALRLSASVARTAAMVVESPKDARAATRR